MFDCSINAAYNAAYFTPTVITCSKNQSFYHFNWFLKRLASVENEHIYSIHNNNNKDMLALRIYLYIFDNYIAEMWLGIINIFYPSLFFTSVNLNFDLHAIENDNIYGSSVWINTFFQI